MPRFTISQLYIYLVIITGIVSSTLAVPYPDGLQASDRLGRVPENAVSASPSNTGSLFCIAQSINLTSASGTGNDIWGWEGPDGKEYVIMGVNDGVVFVDPNTMTILAKINDCLPSGSIWRDMKTYGNYCYAVTECGGTNRGLMIIDMSQLPQSVRLVGTIPTSQFSGWHNIAIDTVTGFAYLAKQDNGFLMIDLSNPENPSEVGWVNSGGCHDLYVDNDTAWVCESWNPFFSAWDLTDKANPTRIVHVPIPNSGFVHQMWVSEDRSYAVTTEETGGKTVKIWDISNLSNISLLSEYLAPNGLAHNIFLRKDTAYISHYTSGVVALDLNDPANPVVIDNYTTFPDSGPNSLDCWGIYPFTSSGRIYASNMNNGELYVFSLSGISADVTIGPAPLLVQFTAQSCKTVTQWQWEFGDGFVSTLQNPSHLYGIPGEHSATLKLLTPSGVDSSIVPINIFIVADTMSIDSLVAIYSLNPQQVRLDISATNHVSLNELLIPLAWPGLLNLDYDSFSTVGLRSSGFSSQTEVGFNLGGKQVAISLKSTAGSPFQLAPGDSPILSVYFTLPSGIIGSNPISLSGYPSFNPKFVSDGGFYQPTLHDGFVTVISPPTCCVGKVGDANNDGNILPSVGDITAIIDYLFVSQVPLNCFAEADVNQSGSFFPTGQDLSVADIGTIIDHLFGSGVPMKDCL